MELKVKGGRTYLATRKEVNGMVAALRQVPALNVDRNDSQGTIKVSHPKGGFLFLAIEKGKGQPWIVTHNPELFL